MEEAKKVSVHVVTWNSLAYLPGLFASLDEQTSREFTVTVVDNASNDGTYEWVSHNRHDVAVLRNFRNQGFARAHNQAIALALSRWPESEWSRRYVLVANPDLEFKADCLQQLIALMEGDASIDACAPKLLRAYVRAQNEDGMRETERSTTIDSTGLVIKKTRQASDRGAGEEDKGQYDSATDVFGFSGACVLFRASSLVAAKLAGEYFDEEMFAYKEDVDLAWRMRRLGMSARFVPEAIAWHHRRAPSAKQGFLWLRALLKRSHKPAYVNFLSTRNHHWMLWKNDEIGNQFVHLVWLVPYELGKCLVGIFSLSAWKANFQALAGLPRMWKKRKELASRAKVSGRAMRKWFV
jgi:GT2 family glycosyltransferase